MCALSRVVLAAFVLLVLVGTSGCMYTMPTIKGKPALHLCWPMNNWRCSPEAEWSDM